MGLMSDIYNTAMGRPSFNPMPPMLNKGLNGISGKPTNPNAARKFATPYDRPLQSAQDKKVEQRPSGPAKLDFRNGAYQDSSRFDPNFKNRVRSSLEGTLRDYSTRNAVAGLFYESRGGNGITKQEIKDGLDRLVKQGKLNEDQKWAVRKKYGVF